MNSLFELIRIQCKNFLFASTQRTNRKKGIGSRLMLMLPFALMAFLAVEYSMMLYEVVPASSYDIVLHLMSFVGIFLAFVLGVQLAQGQLFAFKDFDFLMSLPISSRDIMISKLVSFYLLVYGYVAFFLLPAIGIYGYMTDASILFYLVGFLSSFFVPLIPMVIASVIAMLIRKLAGKSKYKNLFTNIMSVVFVILIMVASFSVSFAAESSDFSSLYQTVEFTRNYLPFSYYLTQGWIELNPIMILVPLLAEVLIFALFIIFFQQTFIRLNSNLQEGYHVKNFQLRSEKQKSVFQTMLEKECRKYFTNFMYVFNTAIGQMMLMFGAGYLIYNRADVLYMLDQLTVLGINPKSWAFFGVCSIIMILGHMTCSCGVSISLEGKNLWITKSLPIETRTVFLSKLMVNVLVIIVPSLICFLLTSYAFALPLFDIIMGILLIVAMAFFVGLFGLTVNLHYPKLVFDREIMVIKQSASSLITIFGGLGISIGLSALYGLVFYSFMEPDIYILLITMVYLFMDVIFWYYLMRGGSKKFASLYN
ncbi:MAG: hypothetical protein PUF50_06595 [Erysipelotrichaceae bacterium]|nr:hypothetical protein [Erysipelotrichaceae bacterium]